MSTSISRHLCVGDSPQVKFANRGWSGWLACVLAALLALLLPPCGRTAEELPRLVGKVTNVVDGDTIDVQLTSGTIRVRVHGIDTPERNQPWGSQATAALSVLVLGKQVELEPFEQDRYERLVARVHGRSRHQCAI